MAAAWKFTESLAGGWEWRVWAKALDSTANMLKVIWADVEVEHFLEHWQEVREGTYCGQGGSGGGTQQSACCG